MTDLDEVVYKANQADDAGADKAGKAVGKAIDSKNKKMERERDKKFNREVKEISKYHGKKAARGTKIFIFRGGDDK